ncbi:hypothetical protein [Rufibacter hautae]|uniref:Uncharacterized protein n=1 Tax=Rufibacter hautae TaxID=2595005 RepID=A0A5B6TIQ3_9BACT|nr:hypothetical protein [Rufibacter hautae]KAA3439896.1 hypothetical protein FOA19_04280 [Rufibacter hautae]
MEQRNPTHTLLSWLAEVNDKLTLLAPNARLPHLEAETCMQVIKLLKEAQHALDLLEAMMRDHPALIAAQIALLEAMILARRLKAAEAIQKAQNNLHLFLESMEDRHR